MVGSTYRCVFLFVKLKCEISTVSVQNWYGKITFCMVHSIGMCQILANIRFNRMTFYQRYHCHQWTLYDKMQRIWQMKLLMFVSKILIDYRVFVIFVHNKWHIQYENFTRWEDMFAPLASQWHTLNIYYCITVLTVLLSIVINWLTPRY